MWSQPGTRFYTRRRTLIGRYPDSNPDTRRAGSFGGLVGYWGGEYVSEARDAMSSCQGEELACIGFPHPACEFFISCEVSLVSSIPLLLSMEY